MKIQSHASLFDLGAGLKVNSFVNYGVVVVSVACAHDGEHPFDVTVYVPKGTSVVTKNGTPPSMTLPKMP